MQYLTILGLSLATVTFSVGLLADATLSPRLFSVKNALALTGTPMEVLISLLYWGLRAIDPKLVMPEWAPPLELHADLSFHLLPTLYLLTDTLLLSPPRTISLRNSLLVSLAIALSYWYWIELCYQHNGFYPYPIFAAVGYIGRVGLFVGSAVIMTAVGATLGWGYSIINGEIIQHTVSNK
jgi:hypothetical protein